MSGLVKRANEALGLLRESLGTKPYDRALLGDCAVEYEVWSSAESTKAAMGALAKRLGKAVGFGVLETPPSAVGLTLRDKDGLTIRYVEFYSGEDDEHLRRVDVAWE